MAILAAGLFAASGAAAQETPAPAVSGVSLFTAPASGDTYQRGDPIEVRVDFDRLVTITGTPQVNLTVGTNTRAVALSSTAGPLSSANSLFFEYTVVEEDSDTDGISVAANAIRLNGGTIKAAADGTTDADLTHSALTADSGHKVDGSLNEVPAVSSVSFVGSPANGDTYELGETIEVKVVFHRFIEHDASPQVALTIGGQTALATYDHGRGQGGGITALHFEYEVQADDFDADGISIPADSIRNGATIKADADGTTDADVTHAAVSDDPTRKVDGALVAEPTVTGVNVIGTPRRGEAYQAGETINLQVWFSRLVTVSGSPYVELTVGNGIRQATFHTHGVEVQGVGFQYTVQAHDSDADGISVAANAIRLDGGTITAIDGTTAAVLTHAAVPADPTRKVGSGTAPPPSGVPSVSSVFFGSSPRSGDTYERGEIIDVRVLFTGRIAVTGRPSLALDIGGQTRAAAFWGTHYGRTASFRYTVVAADRDTDGISVAANAISLDGGSITSHDGSADADLAHAAVAADTGRKVNGSQVTAPAVSGVSVTSRPRGGSTYGRGESIVVEVRFSEAVAVTGSPSLALTVGTATRGASFSRSAGSTLWFGYRVQEDDSDSDGIGIAAGALTLNGGTIKDSDKNDARLDLGSHAIANAGGHRVDADLVDTVAPTVTGVTLISSPQDGSSFVLGETVEIEVQFSEPVTVTGSPRLTLSIGGNDRTAVYASSRLRIVRFHYVVDAGDGGSLAAAPDALNLNGGTILDAGGNAAVLRLGSARISLGRTANGVRQDDDPPTVRSVSFESSPPGGDTYGRGDIVEAAVRFSEPVTVTGTPQLALAVGTETRRAAFFFSGREYVRFRYSVQEQDQAPDGVGVAAGGLSLNGGSIVDAAGNPANLSLATASTAAGHKVDGGVATQTVPTRAAVISQPRDGEVYQRGETVDVEVEFNKEVNVSGQPQLELTIGPQPSRSAAARAGTLAARAATRADTRVASFVSGANERLHFRYVVQAEDDSGGGGISFAADALRLNGATITDAAGRPLGSGNLTLDTAQVVQGDMVDGTQSEPAAPRRATVVSTPQADRTYRRGEHILVDVQFDTGVTVTGAPRLELAIDNAAGAARQASFVSAEHDTIRFRYDVQADDRDEDGIAIPADALRLNGGSIRGSDGEAASLGLEGAEIIVPADKVDGRTTESTPPVVASVTVVSAPSGGSYASGDRVAVEVRFSEAVTVTGRPQLALRIGAATRTAGLSARPMPETIEFAYTLRSGDDAGAGIGVPANAIRLNGGSIRDGVGNDAVLDTSEVLPSVGQAAGPGVRLGCKQPAVANRTLQPASAGSEDGLASYDFVLALELEEHRDGSAQPVELGCVALASPDRRFSYSITRGDTSRFTVGADGALRYIGSGESAARTPAYLLTVTATPDDGAAALHLAVRVVIVATDDGGRTRVLQIGLSGFARTVAATAVQVIGQRFTQAARTAAESDAMDLDVTLNRRTLDLAGAGGVAARGELVTGVAEALGIRVQAGEVAWTAPSGAQLIADSAFSAAGARWGVWGSGDVSQFGGDFDGFRQDGTVLSGYLGVDYRFVPNALAGLAASYSSLDLTSTSEAEGKATLTGSLVNVYPYGLWMPEQWLGIWGIAGFGTGASDLTTVDGGLPDESLLSWLGAAGQRAELWSGGGVSLAAKSDGFVTGIRHSSHGALPEVSVHAWRARLLVEAGLETRPQDARLSGLVELGARLDGGDAQRGLGAEAGAELRYTHTGIGLGVAGRGRMLLVHEDRDIREWGASATLTWTPAAHGAGPSVSVAPSWGRPASGMDTLWLDPDAVLASHGGAASARDRSWLPDSVDVTVGYGLDGLRLEVFGRHLAGNGDAGYRFGLGGSLEY